jgi:hypothetical protein
MGASGAAYSGVTIYPKGRERQVQIHAHEQKATSERIRTLHNVSFGTMLTPQLWLPRTRPKRYVPNGKVGQRCLTPLLSISRRQNILAHR